MIKIYPIRTGNVKFKQFQATGARNQIARLWQLFFTNRWSDWHPVYCWLIEHPDGLFLIDTGESAKVHERGHLPNSLIFRSAVKYDVKREDEVDCQLMKLGYKAEQIKAVYLTHFHSDHMDGLYHFPGARIYASREAFDFMMSSKGAGLGYFRKNLPEWFQPETFDFEEGQEGIFEKSKIGSIAAVPLPGHAAGHTGYMIKIENGRYVFSGDATYNKLTLREGTPFVILNNLEAKNSVEKLRAYAQSPGTVILCSHDPDIPKIFKST